MATTIRLSTYNNQPTVVFDQNDGKDYQPTIGTGKAKAILILAKRHNVPTNELPGLLNDLGVRGVKDKVSGDDLVKGAEMLVGSVVERRKQENPLAELEALAAQATG